MDRLLDIDKQQDYVGKRALQAIAKTGPERRLVGANFHREPVQPNAHFMSVKVDDTVVGMSRVTSIRRAWPIILRSLTYPVP